MWLDEPVARRSRAPRPCCWRGTPRSAACDWAARGGVRRDGGRDATAGVVERALLGSFAGYLAHHAPCAGAAGASRGTGAS